MTFDVAGSAARAVRDRSAAWRFIEGFAAAWAEPIEARDGWNHADLDAAEDRLGVRLPDAVRDAYALFGKRPDLTSNQDWLLTPSELRLDGEVVVFRREVHALTSWGAVLGAPDPAVVQETERGWEPWLPHFSAACVELVLSEALFRDGAGTADREMSGADISLLEDHFALLPLGSPGTRWFVADDLIVREDAGRWLWARARTPEALGRLQKTFPGAWEF
ncbi:hypothetical protein [Lentzea sp. NPDC003310]|uniref:hypothetical protein n=1 Tax=Lentzea sp. NPDC003310 TaxID=3154447 RepID=UPI0033A0A5FC